MVSYLIKDFAKNPTETKPREVKLEAGILSQKITVSSQFLTNIKVKNKLFALNS
jgi:hypothetical protein